MDLENTLFPSFRADVPRIPKNGQFQSPSALPKIHTFHLRGSFPFPSKLYFPLQIKRFWQSNYGATPPTSSECTGTLMSDIVLQSKNIEIFL